MSAEDRIRRSIEEGEACIASGQPLITLDDIMRDRARPIGTPLSEQEAAVLARFDAAPDVAESLRLRLMQAAHSAACHCGDDDLAGNPYWERIADAAIAVMRGDHV